MATQSLRVLMVEDSSADALLVLNELRRRGYALEHRIVATEAEFLAALETASWDVILSDFSMPQFDGLSAFELLKKKSLDIPFLFVSGHIGEDRAADAMLRGASGYILKDKLAGLVPAIERSLWERAWHRRNRSARESVRKGAEGIRRISASAETIPGKFSGSSWDPHRPTVPREDAQADGAALGLRDSSPSRTSEAAEGPLSKRQLQVLLLIAEGKTTKEIATMLGVADKTAEAHRSRIMERLKIHDTAGLVRYAIRRGLMRP